jgi:hypothetical protein
MYLSLHYKYQHISISVVNAPHTVHQNNNKQSHVFVIALIIIMHHSKSHLIVQPTRSFFHSYTPDVY